MAKAVKDFFKSDVNSVLAPFSSVLTSAAAGDTSRIEGMGNESKKLQNVLTPALMGAFDTVTGDRQGTLKGSKGAVQASGVQEKTDSLGRTIKNYFNPSKPDTTVDTSAADAEVLKMQKEEEARRRMRRMGQNLMNTSTSGSTSNLGVTNG